MSALRTLLMRRAAPVCVLLLSALRRAAGPASARGYAVFADSCLDRGNQHTLPSAGERMKRWRSAAEYEPVECFLPRTGPRDLPASRTQRYWLTVDAYPSGPGWLDLNRDNNDEMPMRRQIELMRQSGLVAPWSQVPWK